MKLYGLKTSPTVRVFRPTRDEDLRLLDEIMSPFNGQIRMIDMIKDVEFGIFEEVLNEDSIDDGIYFCEGRIAVSTEIRNAIEEKLNAIFSFRTLKTTADESIHLIMVHDIYSPYCDELTAHGIDGKYDDGTPEYAPIFREYIFDFDCVMDGSLEVFNFGSRSGIIKVSERVKNILVSIGISKLNFREEYDLDLERKRRLEAIKLFEEVNNRKYDVLNPENEREIYITEQRRLYALHNKL